MALRNAKARLLVLKKKVKDIKSERKELEEKFLKVEKEKKTCTGNLKLQLSN